MSSCKYTFVPEKGKVYDFFALLSIFVRYEKYENLYKDLDLEPNKEILKSYNNIINIIDKNMQGLKLFFTPGARRVSLFCELFADDLRNINSIQEIVDKFKSYDTLILTNKILSFYDKNEFSSKFYKLVLSNKELLMEFLNGLELKPDIKWEILSFVSFPGSIINDMCSMFQKIAARIDEEYIANKKMLDKYYSRIQRKFDNEGISFLFEEDSQFSRIFRNNSFDIVQISVCMFNEMSIQYHQVGKHLNVYLGCEYEEGLELIKNVTGNSPLLFKAYSDKTRMNIIELVKKEELCATDISERLDVPMSTLSHHLDILCSADILIRRQEGKKSYFSIKENAVSTAIYNIKSIYA